VANSAQRVRVDDFLEGGALGGSFAGMVDAWRDGLITARACLLGNSQFTVLSSQPAPVLAEVRRANMGLSIRSRFCGLLPPRT